MPLKHIVGRAYLDSGYWKATFLAWDGEILV